MTDQRDNPGTPPATTKPRRKRRSSQYHPALVLKVHEGSVDGFIDLRIYPQTYRSHKAVRAAVETNLTEYQDGDWQSVRIAGSFPARTQAVRVTTPTRRVVE
jgi:hypothetical protein